MLNLFPDLLTFGLLSPLILRVSLGLVFLNFGWAKLNRQKEPKIAYFESVGLKPGAVFVWLIGLLEIVAGILLVAGLFTQVAAIFSAFICAVVLLLKKKRSDAFESGFGFVALCLVISLSLLFTGAGFLAFDWSL